MVSTGRYHITLAHFLLQEGHRAVIVNPVLIKQFSKANTLRKTKTDKIDAALIARYAKQAPKQIGENTRAMDDRRLSVARRREQAAEQVATVKTQLKADLTVAWPEVLVKDVFTQGMLRLLSICDPKIVKAQTTVEKAKARYDAAIAELETLYAGKKNLQACGKPL